MADLRREVAKRLKETLHGKEIDTIQKGMPETPHMLGIVTIGAISTDKAISGSLLDCTHEFWDSYYKDINTNGGVRQEVRSAIQSLKEDGVLEISTPYGEDAGIWYCEVGNIDESQNRMRTVCRECGSQIPTEPDLSHDYGHYRVQFTLDCPDCDFSAQFGTHLTKQ